MTTLTVNHLKASSSLRLNWKAHLSEIELAVSKQVAFGFTQIEAASIFYRSPFTITNTLRRAYYKTGARNIAELAAWIWCREFNATMIISEGKRKIVTLAMVLLILAAEFAPGTIDLRGCRSRRSKDEYGYLAESIDLTLPPVVPV